MKKSTIIFLEKIFTYPIGWERNKLETKIL